MMYLSKIPEYTPDEIRKIITDAGMTQVQAAAKFGVGEVAVSRWVTGVVKPTERHRMLLMELERENGKNDASAD